MEGASSFAIECLARNDALIPYGVHETDAVRSSLAVDDREQQLWLLHGDDLAIEHRWQLTSEAIGRHAIHPVDRVALVSGTKSVELLDAAGHRIWRYKHPSWAHGGYERGCAWFDSDGTPFAVVPTKNYDGCEITALSRRDGTPTDRAVIATAPAGVHVIHQPEGWVGLSVGEGQDGAYAWWVRAEDGALHVVEGGRPDEVLFDVDPNGRRVLMTPHVAGPLTIRSFPELGVLRSIEPPPGYVWDFYACFSGSSIVARAHSEDGDVEVLAAIDESGGISVLAPMDVPICPANEGSWITTGADGIARWRLAST